MEKPKSTESSSGSAQTRCNNCQKRIVFKRELVGRVAKCPGCGASHRLQLSDEAVLDTAIGIVHTTASGEGTENKSNSPEAPNKKGARLLGRFALRRRLGRGGFGEVWEADDTSLNRKVAIKLPLYPPSETKKIQRFLTEGRAAASLRHPNIVGVLDAGIIGSQHFLATELVVGQPLNNYFAEQLCPPEEAARLVSTLARALDYAHSRKIVHRDIKPHNIVLNERKQPQLLDFGLAKILEEDAGNTIDGTVMGTPAYMAPEQARGELSAIGPRTDQYSLGATLYWLLTGRALFEGPHASVIAQVIGASPKKPSSLVPDLDSRLEAICLKAVAKVPADRYASCLELARDLDRFLRDEAVEARPVSAFGRVCRWTMRHPRDATLMAAVSLILFAAMLFSLAGWYTASVMAASAREAQYSTRGKLTELEQTEQKMQAELNRLNTSKARSEQARRDGEAAQRTAEVAEKKLQLVIEENLRLRKAADEQLALVTKNTSSISQVENDISASQATKIDREVKISSLLSENEVKQQTLGKLEQASSAIQIADWDTATATLRNIPTEKRNWLWKMLAERVKKKSAKLEVVEGTLPFSAVPLRLDVFEGTMLLVQQRDAKRRIELNTKKCCVDLSSGNVLVDGPTSPLLAYSPKQNFIVTADNDGVFNHSKSSRVAVGISGKPLSSYVIPYPVDAMKILPSNRVVAVARAPEESNISNSHGAYGHFGLYLLSLTPNGAEVLWDIRKEQAYLNLLASAPKSTNGKEIRTTQSGAIAVWPDDLLNRLLVVFEDSRLDNAILVDFDFGAGLSPIISITQLNNKTGKTPGSRKAPSDYRIAEFYDRLVFNGNQIDVKTLDGKASSFATLRKDEVCIANWGVERVRSTSATVSVGNLNIGTLSAEFSKKVDIICDSRGYYIAACSGNRVAIYKCPESVEL